MVEAEGFGKQIAAQQPTRESRIMGRFLAFIREIIAALFWVYVVAKLFIFDIDIFLLGTFSPNYAWILNYKFFILIGIVATVWLVTKNRHVLLWTLSIFFYPAIVLLWKIPVFVFKQKSWILAFALFDAVISFFRSIKFSFITTSFFLVSLAIIFGFSNEIFFWISIAAVIVILSAVYIHRFALVFKRCGVYQVYNKMFSRIGEFLSSSPAYALDESMTNLPVESLDEKQLQKWTTNVQTLVLFNRICLFVARKLKTYQGSGLNIVSSVLIILALIALTILSFAAVNFGLYKINQQFFAFSAVPTFFTFFYYSFNNLLFNPIQDIVPSLAISQTISMIESTFALFLVAIFVSLVFSVRSQRHIDELNEVMKSLEEQGTKMEGYIREEYKLNNIDDAMASLQKLKSVMTDVLYKITESTKHPVSQLTVSIPIADYRLGY